MNWISLHIFFTSHRGQFLQQCIIPLIEEMIENQFITSYFFINYNEGGSHIRLRLKSKYSDDFIYNNASCIIYSYFSNYPSPLDETRDISFYPNDSVQLITYEPEYSRYGEAAGIVISERQFHYSSNAVLYYIKNNANIVDNYNGLINLALKFHIASAYAYCDKSIEKSVLLFNLIFNNASSPIRFPFIKSNFQIEKTFNEYYLKQKHILLPYIASVWNSFKSNLPIDENFEIWKNNEQEINDCLNVSYESCELISPYLYEIFPTWSIVQSYIHMTNNRLGILPIDEGMIAYLLMRSLKDI